MRAAVSSMEMDELRQVAGMPRATRLSTWSFMREMRGETTRVMPSMARAGSWKQSDLPEPVGMTTTASPPAMIASMGSRWPGLKEEKPKCRERRVVRGSAVAVMVVGFGIGKGIYHRSKECQCF